MGWRTRYQMGFRHNKLTQRAYNEAGIRPPSGSIRLPLRPKSFMDNFNDISFDKTIDFNFIGCININEGVKKHRLWVIDFVKEFFTEKSYFRLNSNEDREQHMSLGKFDDTHSYGKKRFVDKYMRLNMKRCRFDKDYYNVMCASEFTLCPRGDENYSDRFFEVIMSKSIPILERREHCGKFRKQRDIGYKFYLLGDDYVYRQDWVDYNYDLFLQKQTLFGRENEN